MDTKISKKDLEKELPSADSKPQKAEKYNGLHESTQTFGLIGALEVSGGEILLRGRNGERDHLYPIERAVKRYYETERMIEKLALYGVRGWDTLMDINKEFGAKIIEAAKQRESMNLELPASVLEFRQKHDAGMTAV